jgi:hypothetical protein
MRFEAPPRDVVPASVLAHPAFTALRHADLLRGNAWPDCRTLNGRARELRHAVTGQTLHFVAQSPSLLADGLHYEQRIHARGLIATRESNWHDLFNALVWLSHSDLKCAVNTAYVTWAAATPGSNRSRAQSALTHFDEAGALVVLPARLLDAWDRHDWPALFHRERACWGTQVQVLVFGHALFEHLLVPDLLPVAQCLALADTRALADALRAIVADIHAGRRLRDPQELRPLPLAGLPGWHMRGDDEAFYRTAPCFRPVREGRRYPR